MTDQEIPLDISGHEDRDPPSGDGGLLDPGDTGQEGGPDRGNAEAGGDTACREDRTDEDTGEQEEVEPVEVLVKMAEDGAIDPWDIDIVEVTDTFLDRLDEADLRGSGRALFYASVLLRMKSDAMLGEDEPEDDGPEPWQEAMADDQPLEEPDPFATLEREIDRRLERKRARGMPRTLDELVRDLREAERDSWWKESREYDTSDTDARTRGTRELDYRSADRFRMDDEPTESEVTGKTHGEDIDAVIDAVRTAVSEQYERGRTEVLFRELAALGSSRVETYLGVLFLSHRGAVRLRQDELFGDLWIQDPDAANSDEALAS